MRIAQVMESASDSIHVRASTQFHEHNFDFLKTFEEASLAPLRLILELTGYFFQVTKLLRCFHLKKV